MTLLWQGEGQVDRDEEKRSWLSKIIKVRGLEAVKLHSGEQNMIEKNSERVGSPSSFSIALSIPSIGNFSVVFGNFSTTSWMINYSTHNPPEKNPPPSQTLPTSLSQIRNFSPISESVDPQTDNTLTASNMP